MYNLIKQIPSYPGVVKNIPYIKYSYSALLCMMSPFNICALSIFCAIIFVLLVECRIFTCNTLYYIHLSL